ASSSPAHPDPQTELRAKLDGAGGLPRVELRALLREVAASDAPPEPSLWPRLAELYDQADLPELCDAYLHHALPRFPKYPALRELARRRGYDRAANRLELPPDLTPVWRAHLADAAPPNPPSLFDEALLPRERLHELKRLALAGEFHRVEREVLRAFPARETRYEDAARAADVFEALELDHWASFLLQPWGARDPRAALRLARMARSAQEREAWLTPWRDALDPLDLRLLAATEGTAASGKRLAAELEGAQLSPDQRAALCHLRLPRRRGERDAAAEAEAVALLREPLSLRSRVDLWGGLAVARFVRGDWAGALEAARGSLELKPWHGGMQLQVGLSLWAMQDDPAALRVLLPLARSPWRQPLIRSSAAEEVVKLVDANAALTPPLDASAWALLLQRAQARNLRRDASNRLPYLERLLRQAQKVGAWASLVDLATAGAEAYPQRRAEFTYLASLGLRRGQGDAAAERFLEALEPDRRRELKAWLQAQSPR
ncbi:MAG: hypothetical protein KDD82_25925, partial [Planctomycetes bacterium]|nr:hypothetical protein [Planctomycetota bacterium]